MSIATRMRLGGPFASAARFRPTALKSATCVLWLDMLERAHVITPGSGGALGTVGSITNIASGVAWTEGSLPPFYEVAHGRPWLLNPPGQSRRIISTDALPLTAFNGEDRPCTIVYVSELLQISGAGAVFSVGDSTTNAVANFLVAGVNTSTNGKARWERRDGAGNLQFAGSTGEAQPGPHVSAWRFDGTNLAFWRDYVGTSENTVTAPTPTNIGALAVDRAAIFTHPDLTPGSPFRGRIGAVAVFDGALSDDELLRLRLWLVSRWLTPVTQPTQIPNCRVWLEDNVTTSVTEASTWNDKSGNAANFGTVVAGRPDLDAAGHPTAAIRFVAANGDFLLRNNRTTNTGVATYAVQLRAASLPAVGQTMTIASPMFASNYAASDWFEIVVCNQVSGYKTISFARQNGLSGTYQGFDLPDPSGLLDGGIHRLIVRYDGSTYRAWWDGVEMTVEASGAWTRTSGDKGSLGARVSSTDVTSQGFDGWLFKFVCHDRALEDFEIAQLDTYLADGWASAPEILPNRLVHFDAQDADSYEVTAGEVVSARNKASGVLWSEGSNPPEYESDALNGFPCWTGDGVARHLTSTEAAIPAALDGDDAAFTAYAVVEWLSRTHQAIFGCSSASHDEERSIQVGLSSEDGGRSNVAKWDDTGSNEEIFADVLTPSKAHVQAIVVHGQTADAYINDSHKIANAEFLNVGTTTPTRSALFRLPESTPRRHAHARLGEYILYAGAHNEAEVRGVTRSLMAKWGIGFDPRVMSGLVAWFSMLEADAYAVTNVGGVDVVSSLTNLASGEAWNTAAITDFPRYQATVLNGRPCMQNPIGASRGIRSSEAAVYGVFNGTAPQSTVIAVMRPAESHFGTAFGAGNSGVSTNSIIRFGCTTSNGGRVLVTRTDDAGVTGTVAPASDPDFLNPGVISWIQPGTGNSRVYRDGALMIDGAVTGGTLTVNQSALFARPDSVPDTFFTGDIAELLIFNRAVTDAEHARVVSWLMSAERYGL